MVLLWLRWQSVARLAAYRFYSGPCQHRLDIWQREKDKERQNMFMQSTESIPLTLYGGIEVNGVPAYTTPKQAALECSQFNASDTVVALVNDVLWDLNRPLTHSCHIKLLSLSDNVLARKVFWHSSAHILGWAIEQFFSKHVDVELCDGPALDDGGFYYDFYIGGNTASENDLEQLTKAASDILALNHCFEHLTLTKSVAQEMFQHNRFKLNFISQIPNNEDVTVYKCGDFIDLCKGPHIPSTQLINAIEMHTVAGVEASLGQSKVLLQRVYGMSTASRNEMYQWKESRSEAHKRDHRVVGRSQQLYMTHPDSPGSVFLLPHGVRIISALRKLLNEHNRSYGYQEVITPLIFSRKLWETSGHWEHYSDNMFTVGHQGGHLHHGGGQEYGLKPMNCPAHCLIYQQHQRSYRELPLRFAEFSPLHRNEISGALSGLTRVRQFHQDDAHIFCTAEQLAVEVRSCLEFVEKIYGAFGFDYELRLSTRPSDYMGELKLWEEAECQLETCLLECGSKWSINEGDGAFYGPKIDVLLTDAIGRHHQTATIQLDFQLPYRFKLNYRGPDDNLHTPVMIHRAILGSFERFLGILTEHYAGKWPFWISPRQCLVCTVHSDLNEYARNVQANIVDRSFYCDVDESDSTLDKKVRNGQLMQYNFILVVGRREKEGNLLHVRHRDGQQTPMSVNSFCQHLVDLQTSLK
ncbi:threonine--tRNA ligase 1, cytoplasmic-like [Corticium candelabrum]|uniref:threonine--tRNA ligase 1, cytoplasmic-like n=1 Tax=Corticium candelabrum TaxID=121492 RepID=UPI002E26BBE1|nr:threonine--tRNA ligase 1, cytoplasmic-like [Corticium candelabrum]